MFGKSDKHHARQTAQLRKSARDKAFRRRFQAALYSTRYFF